MWQSFVNAGWHPGRSVPVPDSVPRGHPAWDVLAAFGGLVILEYESHPDPDWPPIEEIAFRSLCPCLHVTKHWSELLRSQLVGIAEHHNAHGELYIAADGRCFGSSSTHPAFYFVGEAFSESMEAILLGRRARPMLAPEQESVSLYGQMYTSNSPELYHYR